MNFFLLFFLLSIKAAVIAFLILYSGIGLGPDEAQYWTWSQHLDFGYYSKPPGIAWQIFLGTSLFGNSEFGVRFGALLIGIALSLATYRLAISIGMNRNNAFWAAVIAAFTPLGIFASFLSITDGGMLVFWTLAFAAFAHAVEIDQKPRYLLIGFLIALGALFKWPIYLFWIIVIIGAFLWPNLRSKQIVLGGFVSLLGLLPTLYWNWSRDFPTFRHVTAIVQGGNEGGAANPFAFIGSQVAILSPLLFFLWLLSLFHLAKEKRSLKLLGGSSLAIFLAFVFYACFKKGQGNWCLFAYPAAFVYTAVVWNRMQGKKWLFWSLALSVLLTSFVFFLPTWQSKGLFPSFKIPWKANIFKHNLGWDQLQNRLRKEGFDPEKEFLLADKYQMSSVLSFYNDEKERAFFLNLFHMRRNQFSYWPTPEKGKDAIFVAVENGPRLSEKLAHLKQFYKTSLGLYFESVEEPKEVPLFSAYGQVEKSALIYRCRGYLGITPLEPEKY